MVKILPLLKTNSILMKNSPFVYVLLLPAIPKLHQKRHREVSLRDYCEYKYFDQKKPLPKPLMMDSRIAVSEINNSSLKWLWQTNMKVVRRHKSHNLKQSTTCSFMCFPAEVIVGSCSSAHQAGRNGY